MPRGCQPTLFVHVGQRIGRGVVIETDLRVQEVQDWNTMVSSKWAVIAGFLLLCLPVIIKAIFDKLLKP